MESLFENHSIVNETMIVDYHKVQENKIRRLRAGVTICGGALLIKSLVNVLLEHTLSEFLIITVCVNLLAICFLWFSPPFVIKKAVRRFREFAGGQVAEMICQFSDTIQFSCGEKKAEFRYRQIAGIDYLPGYIVLIIPNKMMLFVSNNGFTKGTVEEFMQFLRTKRPDLTILE